MSWSINFIFPKRFVTIVFLLAFLFLLFCVYDLICTVYFCSSAAQKNMNWSYLPFIDDKYNVDDEGGDGDEDADDSDDVDVVDDVIGVDDGDEGDDYV